MEVRTLGEFELIARLSNILYPSLRQGYRQGQDTEIIGIGDDCAVFKFGEDFGLISTDSLVQNRHFKSNNINYVNLGEKALAVSLSDIASMGGTPFLAVINLQLSDTLSVEHVEEIYRGIKLISERYHCPIVGGNTTAASELSICTTVIGTAKKRPILRGGAQVGDLVWVSGRIGAGYLNYAINKTLYVPTPRVELGKQLLELGNVTSMIDISDGLLQDAMHLARASGVRIELEQELVPFVEDSSADKEQLLRGGEDYELLFTASFTAFDQLSALPNVTLIGKVFSAEESAGIKITSKLGARLYSADTTEGLGWRHFSNP